MPRTDGVYSLPPGYRAISGEIIRPSQHNPPLEDIAQALTESLPRDGSAPMTGDLAMGGNNVTGMSELRIGTFNTGADTGPGTRAIAGLVSVQRPSSANPLTSMVEGWSGNTRVFTLDVNGAGYMGASGVRSPETRIITKELLDDEGLVPETRQINTGDGLQGGGNLTANRTLAVNNTVARRNGAQTFSGVQTFSGGVVVPVDGPNLDLRGDGTNRAAIRFLNNSTVEGQFFLRGNGNLDYVSGATNAFHYNGNTVVSTGHFSSQFSIANPVSDNPTISLAANSVTATQLANNSVGSAQLANNSVGSAQLQNNAGTRDWVGARTSNLSVGAVGTYAFARNDSGSAATSGSTRPGSQLSYSSSGSVTENIGFGTWRCMGVCEIGQSTLWLRVS